MSDKRFFWIKLKYDFMTSDPVDYLMGQKNGAEYVVLYQMLCLKTMQTQGRLERQLNEIIVPYDPAKIQRDCKYFSYDTVVLALELYKKLGLVYAEKSGTYCIADYANFLDDNEKGRLRVEKHRTNKAKKELSNGKSNASSNGNVTDSSVTQALQEPLPNCNNDCYNVTPIELESDTDIKLNLESTFVSKKESKKATKFGKSYNEIISDFVWIELSEYYQNDATADTPNDLYDLEVKLKNYLPVLTKKKLVTNYALEQLLQRLHELSGDIKQAIAIVDHAIVKGYDKFYELPLSKQEQRERDIENQRFGR